MTDLLDDDCDDVHEWLHIMVLRYRGLVDLAEANLQGRDNTPSNRLHARLVSIHELHAERHPECLRVPVPGTLAAADHARLTETRPETGP